MNILFIALAYIDSANDRGIYPDLLRKFALNGHHVFAVTPLERRNNKKAGLSKEGIFTILKVRTPNLVKVNVWEKGLGLLVIEKLFEIGIKKYFTHKRFDLIIYGTPPITLDNLIKKLKRKHEAKTYLLLKDIFPQNAVDIAMFSKNSFFYRYFRKREISLYKISDFIGCMSKANKEYLINENPFLDYKKVEINPNSIEIDNVDYNTVSINFRIPEDKVLIMYGGNLGKPQSIQSLINAIKFCSDIANVHFFIVGSGTEEVLIENWIKNEVPINVTFIKALPYLQYCKLLSLCQIGLIFLSDKFTIPNYPSRLLNYLQLKKPIICATDVSTDIGVEAELYGYGKFCATNDTNTFKKIVYELSSNSALRNQMGTNGYKRFCEEFEVTNSYNIIIKHFNRESITS